MGNPRYDEELKDLNKKAKDANKAYSKADSQFKKDYKALNDVVTILRKNDSDFARKSGKSQLKSIKEWVDSGDEKLKGKVYKAWHSEQMKTYQAKLQDVVDENRMRKQQMVLGPLAEDPDIKEYDFPQDSEKFNKFYDGLIDEIKNYDKEKLDYSIDNLVELSNQSLKASNEFYSTLGQRQAAVLDRIEKIVSRTEFWRSKGLTVASKLMSLFSSSDTGKKVPDTIKSLKKIFTEASKKSGRERLSYQVDEIGKLADRWRHLDDRNGVSKDRSEEVKELRQMIGETFGVYASDPKNNPMLNKGDLSQLNVLAAKAGVTDLDLDSSSEESRLTDSSEELPRPKH